MKHATFWQIMEQARERKIPTHRVIGPGSTCQIGIGDTTVEAVVDYVKLCRNGVLYGLEWWSGRDLKSGLFHASDIRVVEKKEMKIGFCNGQ
jgi:hypothetical protein